MVMLRQRIQRANLELLTLLHVAAKVGNLPLYQQIMDNTEDKNPKNNFGDTPFHMAAINGHLEVCQMLLETPIMCWAKNSRLNHWQP